MPQRQTQKNFFRLNQGLNTEANEINFPDGFTTDEQNYELLVDGSRRRRKGLARESGGAPKATGFTINADTTLCSFKWRAVDGNPDKNFIVHQIGSTLFFTDDAETISTTYHSTTISLFNLRLDLAVTDDEVASNPCQFSSGRGHLFFTHRDLPAHYIAYDAQTDTFIVERITILIRDFDGINDGIEVDVEPFGTITEDHRYNIRNRGWKQEDMDQYFSDKFKHPAKNSLWYQGYRRSPGGTFYDADGLQEFDSDKIDNEAFGNSTAPQGSLFLDPLDTRFAASTATGGLTLPIDVALNAFNTGNGVTGGTFRLTITAHGRSNGDEITITGHSWTYLATGNIFSFTYNRTYTINAGGLPTTFAEANIVDVNTIDIFVPSIHTQFNQFVTTTQDGSVGGGDAINKSDGVRLSVGPEATEFHAGRIFFAGIRDQEWIDTVFFSRIAQKPTAYGKAHQEQDPTDATFNQLQPDDGGTIIIPQMGAVKALLSTRSSLLVFAENGIWEIGGGRRGVFTADGYSVRKITDDECTSTFSPILIGNTAIFTGPKGIFQIAPAEFTGLLESKNIGENLVQSLWNDIPTARQQVVKSVYDDALKRVYLLYGDDGDNINQYANTLILDLRVGAFYKYKFNASGTSAVLTAYAITDSDSSDSRKKVKWSIQATNSIDTADFEQLDFVDFDGAESPLPFMFTGHDSLGDFQRRRQAPIITVHQKRTETEFVVAGNGLDPVNESSCLITALWDWSDDEISGKITTPREVYRHVRAFQPAGAGPYNDGYPIVTTRNKVRGRGRVLQLKFEGAPTKDTHILGYSTNYKIQRAA
jgi:hypothetical protein